MFNKKRIVVIVSFIILCFILITYGATRKGAAKLEVIFIDSYNDKVIDEQIIKYEGDAKVPEDPKHENYVFGGWYLYGSEDTLVKKFTKLTKDLKVEARYKADRNNNGIADDEDTYYEVRFIDGITDEVQKTESVLVGLGATSPTANYHSGYIFIGWDKDYSNITKNLDVNSEYSKNQEPVTMYTLRFFDKAGKVISEQSIAKGKASTSVTIPTYEGYTFDEWNLKQDGTGESFVIGSIVNGNLDIYGQWTINTYEVITDPNEGELIGGSDPTPEENIIEYGEEFTLPTASRNYTLTYHENGENVTINGTKEVTKPVTLLGWCEGSTTCANEDFISAGTKVTIKNDVKYYAVWGNAKSDITVIDAKRDMTASTVYTFGGWSLTDTGSKAYDKNENINLSNNIDLYAIWNESAREYSVKLNGDIDNQNNPSNLTAEQNLDYNTKITLPNALRSYTLTYNTNGGTLSSGNISNTLKVTFLGWCKNSATCETPLVEGTEEKVLNDVVYNATFETNSEKITLVLATKEADNVNTYEFLGWSKNEDLSTIDYTKSEIESGKEIRVTKNRTLYAVWKSTKIDYTLTLNPNGGTITEDDKIPTTYEYNEETRSFPTPTKNYTITYHEKGGTLDEANIDRVASAKFLGWCEGTTDTCETYVTKTNMTANKTYTAAWTTSKETLKITGATKSQTESTVYTFGGWSLTDTGSKAYDKNENINLSNNIDLYAIWNESAREYKINIDSNTTSNLPEEVETGIVDTNEGNPSNLNEGYNTLDHGSKVKLPSVQNSYILTYEVGTGLLLNGAKSVNYVEATFLGWCDKTSCTNEELLPALTEVKVTGNKNYKAVWGTTKENVVIANADKTDDDEYDYTFDGWKESVNDNSVSTTYTPNASLKLTGNLTLYAEYSKVKQEYTIDINGDIDDEVNTSDLDKGDNTLPHGTEFKLPGSLKNYTLTYNVGENATINSGNLTITKPAEFLGWCLGNDTTCLSSNRLSSGATQTVTQNQTYTPVFGNATETITIVGASKTEDDTYTYTFAGWSLTEGGSIVSDYNVGKIVTLEGNLNLYAVYTPVYKSYTLTLNTNGGTIGEDYKIPTTYKYNESTGIFPTPTKSYTLTYNANGGELSSNDYVNHVDLVFLGWCEGTTDTCETTVSSTNMTSNKTYTAKWALAESINLISGAKSSTTTQTFEFEGWYDNNTKYTESIVLTKDTTLVANYTASTRYYEVCFDSAYDKGNLPANQSKEYEQLVTPVSDLSNSNHEFSGWTTENGTSWNFLEDKVTENLTLYAKWKNKVEFDTNDGSLEGNIPSELQEENSIITLPGASKIYTLTYDEKGGVEIENDTINATFIGWCKDSESCETPLAEGTTQTITANTKYYAVYGEGVNAITLPSTTKEADNYNTYTFVGWSTEDDSSYEYIAGTTLTLNSDDTLYAVWQATPIDYTLTLNLNGGVIETKDGNITSYTEKYGYNEWVGAFPTPKKNYTLTYNTNGGTLVDTNAKTVVSAKFVGWCEGTTDTCETTVSSTNMTTSKTYTAKWTTSDEALTLTGATKTSSAETDYVFKEWYYGATNEIVKNAEDKLYLSSNLTINARYTESTRNYTVVFENTNGATNPGNQTVGYGSYATNPGNLSLPGYTFDNWYKENTFTTPWNFTTDTVNTNTISNDGKVHVYGNMTINNYSIRYNLNNDNFVANNSNTTSTYTINDEVTIQNASAPSRNFLGWCEGTTDTCTTYISKIERGSHRNVVLTAKWSDIYTYDVKFEKILTKADGVTENNRVEVKKETVEYGSNYTNTPIKATHEGYICSNWTNTNLTNITSNVTVTSTCVPNLIGLKLEKETTGTSLTFKLYESVDIKDKVKVYKIYTGNELVLITNESEYIVNGFNTNTVGTRNMTATNSGLTSNTLDYKVEGYSTSYDTLFEVRYMLNSYRKTTDRSCTTGPCDSISNTTLVNTNHNFLEIIEYYDQNISVNSVILKYIDGTSITLKQTDYDNLIRWNRISSDIYHPVILAAPSLKKLDGNANYNIKEDVMPNGKVIDEVKINYTISYTNEKYVIFKYNNGTTGEGSFTPYSGGNR